MITANQSFGACDAIASDSAMTVAAIDWLVHHAIILETTPTATIAKPLSTNCSDRRSPAPPIPTRIPIDAQRQPKDQQHTRGTSMYDYCPHLEAVRYTMENDYARP